MMCMCVFQGHKVLAYGCVFTPDGKLLTSGSEQLDVEEDQENSSEDRSERCRSLKAEQDSKGDDLQLSDPQ